LKEEGPHGRVVLSSRVRLARNLAGFPFLSRASHDQRLELMRTCEQRILSANLSPQMLWVDLSRSGELDRLLLVERHLISHQLSRETSPRGVAVTGDESMAIMVNEEDHLRICALRCGMQLDDAYRQADAADDALEAHLDFAFSSRLGYLTACPTNVGTGIRVSVMLHLPALRLTGEIDKLRRAAKDMHLAVRGFYGEGTEATGDLYQVSNQTTLGRSERAILEEFRDVIIPRIIEYEVEARRALLEHRATVLEDLIWRAWATLTHARLLGTEETLAHLSMLRLGVSMERIDRVSMTTLNELFLLSQPGHLQKLTGGRMEGPERRRYRAQYVRQRLGA